MNAVIPANFGQVSTKFANVKTENDLAAGVQAGFGLIGYKGKVWSIRHRGETRNLLRDDGDGPRHSIEVVILKGASYISKIWYEQGYVEGSTAPPDCFSPNGIVPDPSSTKRQSAACANCPQNVWGSKLTEAGKKGKACGDSKRLAVVPLGDIANEMFGGPMLLRVPAASLQDLASYGNKMQNLGYPYFAIATRIAFDSNEAYPKFIFSAIRPLTDEEADQVLALQGSAETQRVLAEGSELTAAEAPAPQTVENAFEQPPSQPKPTAATKPAVTPKVTPKTEPKAETVSTGGFGPVSKAATDEAPAPSKAPAKAAAKAPAKAATKPAVKAPPVVPDEDEVEAAGEEVEEASTEEEGTGSSFEEDLDAQLAALLPD